MKRLIQQLRSFLWLVTINVSVILVLYLSSLTLRSRAIKPSFFTNDRLVELNPVVRLLFIGTWQAADRRGLLEDRPMKLKIQILPADDCDVDEGLFQLQDTGFIVRYHDNKAPERRYIKIVNFPKHQNPHKDEKENEVPEFDAKKHGVTTRPAQCQHGTDTVPEPPKHHLNPADSYNLTPDSLFPDSSTIVDPLEGSTKKGIGRVFGEDSVEFPLCRLLRNLILANRPGAKVPDDSVKGFSGWNLEMNRLLRIDHRDPAEVEKVIKWSQAHSFWHTNILSPSSLRRNYDKLAMQMEAGDNGERQQTRLPRPRQSSVAGGDDEDRRPKPYIKRERN